MTTKKTTLEKRVLAIKFPRPSEDATRRQWWEMIGSYRQPTTVEVTLTHGGTVIRCDTSKGLKTASQYLRSLR